MAHIITIANAKGSVGRTVLCWHMAHRLSEPSTGDGKSNKPQRVLCVDLSDDCDLSFLFLKKYDCHQEMCTSLEKEFDISNLIGNSNKLPQPKTYNSGIDFIAGEPQRGLYPDNSQRQDISSSYKKIRHLAYQGNYDYILIDTSPGQGDKYNAALLMADYIISPSSPDLFSVQGFFTIEDSIKKINNQFGKSPKSLGIFFMNYKKYQIEFIEPMKELVIQHKHSSFENNIPFSESIKKTKANKLSLREMRNSYVACRSIDNVTAEMMKRIEDINFS